MNTQAQEVPLIELLKAVPKTARLIVESEDGISSRAHPVGDLCHKAAEALDTKQVCENAAPAQDTETMAVAIALQEQIRQLKEQPAQEYDINEMIDKITPENLQEPVAWMDIENFVDAENLWDRRITFNQDGYGTPLYLTPPAAAQPLSDDEIQKTWYNLYPLDENNLWTDMLEGEHLRKFARAIETLIKEKNSV